MRYCFGTNFESEGSMRAKVLFVSLLSFFIGITCEAQTSALRIQSSDSTFFKVTLDGYPTPDSAVVVIDFVFDSTSFVLGNLELQKDSTLVNFEINLSPGITDVYELALLGNQYVVLPFLKTPLVVDSLSSDTIIPLKFDITLSNKSFVPSVIGCNPPSNNFNVILSKIASETFSFRKEKLIRTALNSHCFRVDQIQQLLEEIDYEDKRIALIDLAYQHTYDLNNFTKLRSLFYLEKYLLIFDNFVDEQAGE